MEIPIHVSLIDLKILPDLAARMAKQDSKAAINLLLDNEIMQGQLTNGVFGQLADWGSTELNVNIWPMSSHLTIWPIEYKWGNPDVYLVGAYDSNNARLLKSEASARFTKDSLELCANAYSEPCPGIHAAYEKLIELLDLATSSLKHLILLWMFLNGDAQ